MYIKVLLAGEEKHIEFYALSLSKAGHELININTIKPGEEFKVNADVGLLFYTKDIHSLEEILKDLKVRFKNFNFIPVIQNKSEYIYEVLFQHGMEKICFDYNPDAINEELKLYKEMKLYYEKPENTKNYIINFFENKGSFIIDISGSLVLDKLMGLKLMFLNYLNIKLPKLKGIIFVFNNTREETVHFQSIWALFRFWKNLGIDYKKIFFLTSSQKIKNNILKYVGDFGVNYADSLFTIVNILYPEVKKQGESAIFDFASNLLQPDTNKKIA